MTHDMPSTENDYKKRQENIKEKLRIAAGKTDAKILESKAKEEMRDKPEIREKCEMTRMLVDEGISMFEKGKMSYEDMVDDLHRSLMAVAGMKGKMSKKM